MKYMVEIYLSYLNPRSIKRRLVIAACVHVIATIRAYICINYII